MTKAKILKAFFVLSALAVLAAPARAEAPGFSLSLGAHYSLIWLPSSSEIRDIYGPVFEPVGFSFRGTIGESFAIEVSADIMAESGTPVDPWGLPVSGADASMTLVPVHLSAIYLASLGGNMDLYFGAGVSMCTFREEVTAFGFADSASESAAGFHAFAGFQMFKKNFGTMMEVRYFTASIEGISGDVNVGGFGIYLGVMVRFEVRAKK